MPKPYGPRSQDDTVLSEAAKLALTAMTGKGQAIDARIVAKPS